MQGLETTVGRFLHGVASGDPGIDSLLLWTRISTVDTGPAVVRWEIATDPDFVSLAAQGAAVTDSSRDWTVKVDVRDLDPGTRHYYRFASSEGTSPTGRANTLPSGLPDQVRLAVVSCANYPAGHFNVYREIAKLDALDAVLHLGDYIYEDGADGFAAEDAVSIGRELAPDNRGEAVQLEDYRRRYAHYRRDEDLQSLHAAAPMIAILDDHEIANNVWREGAENPDPTEGEFVARLAAALQAWTEWMPVREGADGRIMRRRFAYGDLVELHMVDARVEARDVAVDRNAYVDPVSRTIALEAFQAAIGDPNRSMIGDAQLAWLQAGFAASSARWQLLGQQVPMARLAMPAEMRIDPDRRSDPTALAELAALVSRRQADPSALSDAQHRRLATRIPYYRDGWDAYPAERERVFAAARRADANLIVLAGDTHNAWASDLHDADGQAVGVEFAATAVTSPGLARAFGVEDRASAATVEDALVTLIDDARYVNVLERGFLLLEISHERASAQWHFVDTVSSPDYRIATRSPRFSVLQGKGQRHLLAEQIGSG